MNERTRELAEQAGLKQGEWAGHPPVWMETLDSIGGLKKFVELIVGECADICRHRKMTPSAFTADELLEHFGVER